MTPTLTRERKSAIVGLGVLCPGVLLLFAVTQVVIYIVPPETIGIDVWAQMTSLAWSEGPLRPSAHAETDRYVGDLARLANLRIEEYSHISLTSDELGYRNPRLIGFPAPADAFLGGDSFAVGGALSDKETLSEQLHDLTGWNVYNMARPYWNEAPEECVQLINRLGQKPKLFIYEHLERLELPARRPPAISRKVQFAGFHLSRGSTAHKLAAFARELGANNRLRLAITSLRDRMENWANMPAAGRAETMQARLQDGRSIVFHRSEFLPWPPNAMPEAVEFFEHYRQTLLNQGVNFLVVLVPNKLTVYNELLAHPYSLSQEPVTDALERELQSRGIRVINLTHLLKDEAQRRGANSALLYHRQDTHWNSNGATFAARAIAAVLRNMTGAVH